jgi:hypothetical protein
MQTARLPSIPAHEADAPADFNVVIAYEDFETGKHAKKTYDFLVEHLGDECRFNNQMWKFDVLGVSKLREMAAKDAAEADIIIVSAHGNSDLPSEVKAWMELWITEPSRAIALVGLFGAQEYLSNPARGFLARAARRAGIEFFSQPGLWPERENAEEHGFGPWAQNGKTFSLLADMVQRDREVSHWGINE